MDLKQAKEIVKFDLESANVIVVLSNKSVWKLDKESEIEAVNEYAKNNKLELFVVKNCEVKSEVVAEEVSIEEKPKKKK